MKVHQLFVVAFLIAGTSVAIAQDSVRLQLEIVKDGSTVATPEVSVIPGSTGTIELDRVGRIAFTPTLGGSESVAVAFDIRVGGKRLQPRLVISRDEPGSVSWQSDTGSESFKIRVSWIR
jgi:hypothetical protein